MTTYDASSVSDAVIAFRKPITLQQGRGLRDNLLAVIEGDATAPRVQRAAIQDAAINRVKLSTGTNSGSYSTGSGGGSGSISLDAYSFFPQHSGTATLSISGGTTADTPTLAWSASGASSGTVRWRYILA